MPRFLVLLLVSVSCQSCLYYMNFEPPAPAEPAAPNEPLSLTVTLDGLDVYEDGKRQKPGDRDWDRLHRGFNEALEDARLFTVLEPRASQANLHVDETFHLQMTAGSYSTAFAYGLFIAPGILPIPFPFHAECTHALSFRAEFPEERVTVRQYRDQYMWRVLAASIWAPLVSQDELSRGMVEHHTRMLRTHLHADSGFFAALAPLLIAGDRAAVRAFVASAPAPMS